MRKANLLCVCLGGLLLALSPTGAVASEKSGAVGHPLDDGLDRGQREALERIALQPLALHPAIVEVASHEILLLRIPTLWSDFELAVEPLIHHYDIDERSTLQILLRHPGLVEAIVAGGPAGEPELRRRVAGYPPAIRERAVIAGREHYGLLRGLSEHTAAAGRAFEQVIAGSPPETQRAFREVIARPELVSLLIEEFDAAQQLAGAARVDRPGTVARLGSLQRDLQRQQRQAAERRQAAEAAEQREQQAREQRARAHRERHRAHDRFDPDWGGACWYGAPSIDSDRRLSRRHCWYPWHRYGRRWW